jgi:hypothetical protein
MANPHRPALPSRAIFIRRLGANAAIAALIVLLSLAIGAAGYHWTEHLPWIDAVLNASMILTGMGPVDTLHTEAGKLFASAYALFSGVVFLTMIAVLFAPLLHRFLHRFHLEFESGSDEA